MLPDDELYLAFVHDRTPVAANDVVFNGDGLADASVVVCLVLVFRRKHNVLVLVNQVFNVSSI